MIEKIVPITNFKGYFISNLGNVYSNLGRGNRDKNKTVEMYQIKPRETKNGYLRVYMRHEDNKRKDRYIHRLVAIHFIPNIENKKVVHHKDSNRKNNNVNNLEWVTYKENNQYTLKNGDVVRCSKTGKFQSR